MVIEWFFTSVFPAIETCYQNVAVMAVWKKKILVAVISSIPLSIWNSYRLLQIVIEHFYGSLTGLQTSLRILLSFAT